MAATGQLRIPVKAKGWEGVDGSMKVVTLSTPLRLLVPALLVSSLPVETRAVTFEGGRLGVAVGAAVVAGSLAIAWAFYAAIGVFGAAAVVWLLGGAGAVMMVNGARPLAFVKPICVRCRLLPVIREHEAIHLSGVDSDDIVWEEMRTRHSCESLGLDGDPSICSFCPIPRRLKEKRV